MTQSESLLISSEMNPGGGQPTGTTESQGEEETKAETEVPI